MRSGSVSSRLAALALLLLVVFVLAATIVQPLWGRYTSNRDLIADLESQLARFEEISNRESALQERLAGLKKKLERSGLMLEAQSATLASAALQERVKTVVDAAGGTLASTQVMVGEAGGGFQPVSVNARMTGSIANVQSVLHGLESTPPALVVDDLLIVTRRTRIRAPGQANEFQEVLDVRFKVTGFYDARTGQGRREPSAS